MKRSLRIAALLLAAILAGLLAGCGAAGSPSAPVAGPAPSPTPPAPPAPSPGPSPAPPPSPGTVPRFDHVVLVVEENHSYDRVIGNPAIPYLNQLAKDNALATQYFANAHPSIPNYFMLTTGETITLDDGYSGTVTADNIVRELLAAGKTWKSYAESLPGAGYTGGDAYPYLRRHNPLSYMSDVVGTAQASNLAPFADFSSDLAAGRLPSFAFIAPNAEHDAHDCPDGSDNCSDDAKLSAADTWLQQNIGPLLNDTNFRQSGLLMVVFDEGDMADTQGGGGHIAMVMAGSGVKKGFQSSTRYDHAALLRLMLQALGVTQYPGAAASAPEMTEMF
jgi:phosphatidylinositol-3-phosphatase